MVRPPASRAPGSSPTSACGWVLLAAGVTLVLASILHAGLTVPLGATRFRDPFAEAAIPEAILGVLCIVGSISVLARWPNAYWLAMAAAGLSLLGTGYGLRVTLGGGRPGDVAYHLGLLAFLVAALVLLLRGDVRRLLIGGGPRD
jgi:hypothetical protein